MAGVSDWLLDYVTGPVLESISELSGGGIRSAARQIIDMMVPFGFKAGETVDALRGYGLGYRYQDMLNDIRGAYSLSDNKDYLSNNPLDKLVPKSRMAELDLPRDANYLVTFHVQIDDPLTGQTHDRYMSMYTDDRVSPSDYWDDFYDSIADFGYSPYESVSLLTVESVVHNRLMPYE